MLNVKKNKTKKRMDFPHIQTFFPLKDELCVYFFLIRNVEAFDPADAMPCFALHGALRCAAQ